MTTDKKLLKEMDLVIKARNGRREIHTVVYVDSAIEDTVIGRGKIECVDSVQFNDRRTEDNSWWYCRRAKVNDLIEYFKDVRSYHRWFL